jgi:hypothetical protein
MGAGSGWGGFARGNGMQRAGFANVDVWDLIPGLTKTDLAEKTKAIQIRISGNGYQQPNRLPYSVDWFVTRKPTFSPTIMNDRIASRAVIPK